MRRTYRQRKYYCGEYLEVEVYPVYAKAKGRGKRKKPTTDIQQRLNRSHSAGKLRRLLFTNFTENDLFVTLTFDDNNIPLSGEDAQRLLQNFLRRAKRRYCKIGVDLKYIYVLEYGMENHRLHVHLVISGGLSRAELEKLWSMGEVSADGLRYDKDSLTALAKYFTKSDTEENGRVTWKRWTASRNLEKPQVEVKDRQLSHGKMADLCQNGGDTDYLETLLDGYEIADFSVEVSEDIYGGYYLSATLKKIPPRGNLWTEIWGLPF